MTDGIFGPRSKTGSPQGAAPSPVNPLTDMPTLVNNMAGAAWKKRFREKETSLGAAFWVDLPSNYQRQEGQETPGEFVELPDDEKVKVAVIRMPLQILAQEVGRIPDALAPIVQEFIEMIESKDETGAADRVTTEFQESPEKTYEKWDQLLKFVWMTVVVAPGRFTWDDDEHDPDNMVFSVHKVDYYDRLFVYQYSQGVDQSVREFLQFQSDFMGSLGDVAGLSLSAGPTVVVDRSTGRVVSVAGQSGGVAVGEVHQGEERGDDRGPSRQVKRQAERHQAPVQAGADPRDDLRGAARSKGTGRAPRRTKPSND